MSINEDVLKAIRKDTSYLYYYWRGLLYPNQLDPHPVTGVWRPNTLGRKIIFNLWCILGLIFTFVTYPLILIGILTENVGRFSHIIIQTIGFGPLSVILVGTWVLAGVFVFPDNIVMGSILGLLFGSFFIIMTYIGYRRKNQFITYPSAINAIFIPQSLMALLVPRFKDVFRPFTSEINRFILRTFFEPIGIRSWIHRTFEIDGVGLVIFWFLLSIIVGLTLALLVESAKEVRNSRK